MQCSEPAGLQPGGRGAVQPLAHGGSSGAREGDGEGHKARAVMAAVQCCYVRDEEATGKNTLNREILGHEAVRSEDHSGGADAATVGTSCGSKQAQ